MGVGVKVHTRTAKNICIKISQLRLRFGYLQEMKYQLRLSPECNGGYPTFTQVVRFPSFMSLRLSHSQDVLEDWNEKLACVEHQKNQVNTKSVFMYGRSIEITPTSWVLFRSCQQYVGS